MHPDTMNVGILTLHNNRNKGSLLQNYRLRETVRELAPDATVRTIDYRCRSHEFKRIKNSLITKQLDAVPARVRDFIRTERFAKEFCALTEERLISDDYDRSKDFVEEFGFDVVLVGSDTVWKVEDGFRNRFSGQRPFPNVYFWGDGLSADAVAYAASANKTRLEALSASERRLFGRLLEGFSAIGVRDSHTAEMLDELDIDAYERVPDPTLLGELPSPDVSAHLEHREIDLDANVLGVNASTAPTIARLVDRFRAGGYQVVAPNDSPYADAGFVGRLDPFEHYSIHGAFDFMITSSLHSTIFCLLQKTPFLTVDVDETYSAVTSKTKSLLTDFEMEHRHIDGFATDPSDIPLEDLYELDDSERERIDRTVTELRYVGRTFLSTALDSTRNER